MARYAYTGVFKDGSGKIVPSGTVTIYLAGTTTLASVYTASSGGDAVNSVTSDATNGSFTFYADRTVYASNQQFKLVLSKTGFTSQTYDNIQVGPCSSGDIVSVADGTLVWDPGSLIDGAGETSGSITATGAVLGDYVVAAAPYSLQGITMSPYVDAADSVKIRLQNETTGTINLASGTWKVKVFR